MSGGAGTSGDDWQEVSSSILFSHILSSRVSVVFSALVLLTHILASCVSVSEQCSVLCVLNPLLS